MEGSGVEAERAYAESFPETLRMVTARAGDAIRGWPADRRLVLCLGLTPEPAIFSLITVNPRRALILVTSGSRRVVEDVRKFVPDFHRVDVREVDSVDPVSVYSEVRQWHLKTDDAHVGVADITGGTKAMSSALTLVAHRLGYRVIYWAGTQTDGRSRPAPGSEELRIIANPEQVLGERLVELAQSLARRHEYAGAAEALDAARRRVPGTRSLTLDAWANVLHAYRYWDAMDVDRAAKALEQALHLVRQHGGLVAEMMPLYRRASAIAAQLGALEALRALTGPPEQWQDRLVDASFATALTATFYHGGFRQFQQGRYETAVLLWYRLLELAEQVALAHRGIHTARPDLERIRAAGIAPERLRELFASGPPSTLDLTQGYRLLQEMGAVHSHDMNRIRSIVHRRNHSLFAHGFQPVDESAARNFLHTVEEIAFRVLEPAGITPAGMEPLRFVPVEIASGPPLDGEGEGP